MKGSVYSLEGKAVREIDLPPVFDAEKREDLVKRAVLSEESKGYQVKGNYRFAGMETSARYRGRKEDYGTGKNMGIAHRPHEVLPGGRLGKVKRSPSAVKGRRAHPPKTEKKIIEEINKKEYAKALKSALAFTADRETVSKRMSTDIKLSLPLIVDNSLEGLKKTKEVLAVLKSLNMMPLVEKARKNGTKSPLIVVSEGDILKSASNVPGVDVVKVEELKVKHLAPGTHPGRITIFTEKSLAALAERVGGKK